MTAESRDFGGSTSGAEPKTVTELQALLPDAHIETVGERNELVIYTGWSYSTDGDLVPMPQDLD